MRTSSSRSIFRNWSACWRWRRASDDFRRAGNGTHARGRFREAIRHFPHRPERAVSIGVAQIVELTGQLRGRAGARQRPGAKVALAENNGSQLAGDSAVALVTILST
jgi:hypothetical protein